VVPKVIKLQHTSILIIGLGIGFAIALIGGLIDYLLSKRKYNSQQTNHLPGCMLYVAGFLGFLGIISIIVSFIMSGSIGPALVLGAGVLGGFYSGFALLIMGYLLVKRFWPDVGR
jgi:purine-cytosine permease-like protein